jgi:hypothetical protein
MGVNFHQDKNNLKMSFTVLGLPSASSPYARSNDKEHFATGIV